MSLKIVRITRDFPDMNALEQIAVEAFPPQEYVSPQDLLSYTESSDDCDFWGFYAGKDFIRQKERYARANHGHIALCRIDSAYNIRRGIRNDATYDNRHTLDELRLDTFRRP